MPVLPTLTARLPSDRRAPWVARQSIGCLEDYVRPAVLDDVRLLLTELVTNAVRHSADEEDQRIELEARPAGGSVRVEVANQGSPEFANPLDRPAAGSGWGLLIVAKVASRWGIETAPRTCVWFEIDVDPAGGSARAGDQA